MNNFFHHPSFFLTAIVVAITTVSYCGVSADVGTGTDDSISMIHRSRDLLFGQPFNSLSSIDTKTTSSSSKNINPLNYHHHHHHRKLNFFDGLWNNIMDGIGSIFGSGFGGSNDNESSSEYMIQGGNDNDNANLFGNIIDWGSEGAWQNWLSVILNSGFVDQFLDSDGDGDGDGVLGGLLDLNDLGFLGTLDLDDLSFDDPVCTLIEMGIGMASGFAVKANCDCYGNILSGMEVLCSFDQCAIGAKVCGSVDLGFEFGRDGKIQGTACVDLSFDKYEDTCYSYIIDMRSLFGRGSNGDTQSCMATYGENQCACTIDDTFCLSIDCTPYLPGGKMDTCQMLSMMGSGDSGNWFPNFETFRPDFEDTTTLDVEEEDEDEDVDSEQEEEEMGRFPVRPSTGMLPSYYLP